MRQKRCPGPKGLRALCLCAAIALLAGCASSAPSATTEQIRPEAPAQSGQAISQGQEDFEPYQAPPFADSPFEEGAAQDCGAARLDLSHTAQGYIAAKSQSDQAVVLLVIFGEQQYKYWLPRDGSAVALPLNMGDGTYRLRVMENITDSTYAETWAGDLPVQLADEFQPYLRPNQMVNYTQDSDCVALAARLAGSCEDSTQLVSAVYGYLVENIVYDQPKADTVQSGYLPDPDETLATGKGICFDYAALAASMLRSQGVPTRLITGYVSPNDLYHAWNQIYIQGQGWITVEIKAQPGNWQRVDITFAAGGTSTDYLTNDANYTDRYVY